jgi:hypothetical protein
MLLPVAMPLPFAHGILVRFFQWIAEALIEMIGDEETKEVI